MKFTIKQLLLKAIVVHKENKIEEAERLYKEILAIQPAQPETIHNLGVLKSSQNKLTEAILYFKEAIDANPDVKQFWLSYGYELIKAKKYEEAEVSFRKVIELKSDCAEAHNSLGAVLQNLNKLDEAEESYKKTLELNPNYIQAYCNLGILLTELERLDEAKIIIDKAIDINPNNENALLIRGNILLQKKYFEMALKDFNSCNSNTSRSLILSSLYNLGRTKEIYERIEKNLVLDDKNLEVAAFSSFISYKKKKVTAHKFCNNPIDFVYSSNLSAHLKNSNLFITKLIDELKNVKAIWEPSSKTTKKGFQGMNNLFEISSKELGELLLIIKNELDSYYSKFKDETCSFIQKWPTKKNLIAWHVILKKQGFQEPHIHASGWLSGVVYLKVVPHLDKNEGAIELSLNNKMYFDVNSAKLIHKPKVGDIILFPSSLHHRTIPFTSDEDRISIAFDLMPSVN